MNLGYEQGQNSYLQGLKCTGQKTARILSYGIDLVHQSVIEEPRREISQGSGA